MFDVRYASHPEPPPPPPPPVTVRGVTTLQFRSSTDGQVKVTLTGSGVSSLATRTRIAGALGNWNFAEVATGVYTLSACASGYLCAELVSLEVGSTDVVVPEIQLKAGDIDGNGFVIINDITGTIANFGLDSPQPW